MRYSTRMVLFTLCFTIGVWLLQQQAALPGLWLGVAAARFSARIADSGQAAASCALVRALLLAVFALGLGFYHAAWQAQQRLAITLPDEWQGRDIEVTGVVAELPRKFQQGQHFSFDVEKILTPHASVPKHIYLSTYQDRKPQRRLHCTPGNAGNSRCASSNRMAAATRTVSILNCGRWRIMCARWVM